MTKKSPRIRQLMNLLSILVIIAVGISASRFYESSGKATPANVDLPALKALKPIPVGGFYIRPETAGRVLVALEIRDDATQDNLALDIVNIFEWGRGHFGPIKCGPDYPPNLCKIGEVGITLVNKITSEVLGPEGYVEIIQYERVMDIACDQVQIDKLLANPPADIAGLEKFLGEAAEATIGTGCYVQTYDPPVPFEGF